MPCIDIIIGHKSMYMHDVPLRMKEV